MILVDSERSVTGSSTGIGREIAKECARHDAKLVLHHIGDQQALHDIEVLKTELRSLRGTPSGSISDVDVGVDVTEDEAGQRYSSTICVRLMRPRSDQPFAVS